MAAYYNEIDPYAAQWLRNLIDAGAIAPGDVDERSIADVKAEEIENYTQCHFFAGIGVWSYALRLAGWPDDRPVWTGSCPCQPFSGAGKRGGFSDERHLWPVWFNLIRERRPCVILGEQVASPDGYAWFDHVQADMEGLGDACGAVVTPAAGYGAPHGRHRQYFVAIRMADADDARLQGWGKRRNSAGECVAGQGGMAGRLANANGENQGGRRIQRSGQGDGAGAGTACERSAGFRTIGGLGNAEIVNGRLPDGQERQQMPEPSRAGEASRMGDSLCNGSYRASAAEAIQGGDRQEGRLQQRVSSDALGKPTTGPVNGFWQDADWLLCRDGKWRPVESGTFPLAHRAAARVGRLRAYGNAIVAPQAAEFIKTVMEIVDA